MAESFIGFIASPLDAALLIHTAASRSALVSPIQRRLLASERASIRSGSIFVFCEADSGMRRWTDGMRWSKSRVEGQFLVYRRLDQPPGMSLSIAAASTPSLSSSAAAADDDGSIVGPESSGDVLGRPVTPPSIEQHSQFWDRGHAQMHRHSTGGSDDGFANDRTPSPTHMTAEPYALMDAASPPSSLSSSRGRVRRYAGSDEGANDLGGDDDDDEEYIDGGRIEPQPAMKRQRTFDGVLPMRGVPSASLSMVRQMSTDSATSTSSMRSFSSNTTVGDDILCKRTFSITVHGAVSHVICYYTRADVAAGVLPIPSNVPAFASMVVPAEYMDPANYRLHPKGSSTTVASRSAMAAMAAAASAAPVGSRGSRNRAARPSPETVVAVSSATAPLPDYAYQHMYQQHPGQPEPVIAHSGDRFAPMASIFAAVAAVAASSATSDAADAQHDILTPENTLSRTPSPNNASHGTPTPAVSGHSSLRSQSTLVPASAGSSMANPRPLLSWSSSLSSTDVIVGPEAADVKGTGAYAIADVDAVGPVSPISTPSPIKRFSPSTAHANHAKASMPSAGLDLGNANPHAIQSARVLVRAERRVTLTHANESLYDVMLPSEFGELHALVASLFAINKDEQFRIVLPGLGDICDHDTYAILCTGDVLDVLLTNATPVMASLPHSPAFLAPADPTAQAALALAALATGASEPVEDVHWLAPDTRATGAFASASASASVM